MLINALNPAELRVALTDDSTLEDFKVDVAERGMTRGNIYFGFIANIQPSLNAAFIEYGSERHGFLAIQDVVPDAYYRQPPEGKRPRIEDVLERGKPIVVQVTREPEGQKGSALTTNLSLAGRYLVLTPFEDSRGISRKVTNEDERKRLYEIAHGLELPKGCGLILRTNALEQNKTALNRDLAALLRLWKRISTEAREARKTRLLYTDQDIVLQALRDYLDADVEEVIVDEEQAHERAQEYMRSFMPRSKTKLVHYQERLPLFAAYQIESQIERIFERSVPLPSGGSIVIDSTEALTAIDVNSGKSTRAATQEETALNTNLEAASEVARQLRLRDIGGLVVVDFIDMRQTRSQNKVEKALRDAMKPDKSRFSTGRISSNGLLEINRQRLHQAVQLRTHETCPTCGGTGRIRSPEMTALHLLRSIEARAAGGFMKAVHVALHPEVADFIQNHRRGEILRLEQEFDLKIDLVASAKLHRAGQDVTWFARDRVEIERREKEDAERRVRDQEQKRAASIRDADDYAGDEREEDEEADVTPEAEASDTQPAKKRAKRRRRGGRRRNGEARAEQANGTAAAEAPPRSNPDDDEADFDGPLDAPLDNGDEEAEGPDGKDAEAASEDGAPKRKRRRGRRRGRRRPAGEGTAGTEGGDAPPAEALD
jgi:ribonuclease E